MNNHFEPFAVLVSVDGTPDRDYLVPFSAYEGQLRGGDTPLDPRQTLDLLERGYKLV